jgi:sortase A
MMGEREYEQDVSVLAPAHGEKTLTLVTCYPFYFVGTAPKRFIVQARQIGPPSPLPAD